MPKTIKLNPTQKIAIAVNVVIRTITPLWVFINPWQGAVIALVTDCIDYRPLVRWLHVPQKIYQLQDKLLDYYWYILILLYALHSIRDLVILWLIIFSFIVRSIGQIIFTISKKETVLLFFPNIQEPIFWAWLLSPALLSRQLFPYTILMVLILKLANEYYTHVLKGNPLDQIFQSFHIKTKL